MPESPPPTVAGNTDGSPQETLTADAIEALLADFRSWLEQVASAPAGAPPHEPEPEPIDLHTLLGQLIALRHEVNLQTRSTRAQQEQNGETLRQLGQAVETLRRWQADRRQETQQAQDEAARPFIKTLLDAHDALALAGREAQRVQEAVLPSLDRIPAALEAVTSVLSERERSGSSVWGRWFGGQPAAASEECRQALQEEKTRARQAADQARQFLGSLLTGYTMGIQRLERALEEMGLVPSVAIGQPFDPEKMEAVATVADSGRPAGEVVEEIRRGYLWHGRVFRYAQVSVAR
jgi:molecular chaperone GrpE